MNVMQKNIRFFWKKVHFFNKTRVRARKICTIRLFILILQRFLYADIALCL